MPGDRPDYRTVVGLYLNRRRIQALQAQAVADGIAAAFGQHGGDLIEAMAETPEDVPRVAMELAFARMKAEAERERAT